MPIGRRLRCGHSTIAPTVQIFPAQVRAKLIDALGKQEEIEAKGGLGLGSLGYASMRGQSLSAALSKASPKRLRRCGSCESSLKS